MYLDYNYSFSHLSPVERASSFRFASNVRSMRRQEQGGLLVTFQHELCDSRHESDRSWLTWRRTRCQNYTLDR